MNSKVFEDFKGIGFKFIIFLFLSIANGYFFNFLNEKYFHYSSSGNGISDFSKEVQFIIIVFLTPIIETTLFQYIPNIVLLRFGIKNKAVLIFIPSILFGVLHYYFWLYAIMAFLGGILLNTLYIYTKEKSKYYLVVVALFHACYNLFGYLFVL